MTVKDGLAEAAMESGSKPVKAELYYTTDSGRWQDRKWQIGPAKIEGRRVRAEIPASRPITFHLAVTDSAGHIITTRHLEMDSAGTVR